MTSKEEEISENNKKPEEKKFGGGGDDDDDTSSVGIPDPEGGQKRVSHWTTLARLHRLHLLVSAASGVPYDRKLLERRRKPEAGASNRKSMTIGGAEEGDDCRIDVDGRSRGLSISAPFPYNDNNNDNGDDDDDEDGEGSETAAASRPYIKSAIPYLPRRAAVLCLVLNIAVPGTGTMLSGLCAVCCGGTPRLKGKEGLYAETVCVNLLVGVMQLFTVTFLLVGWIWSFVWGVYMVLLAVEQSRRLKAKHKKELKVKALTALNGRLRAWTLQGNREN